MTDRLLTSSIEGACRNTINCPLRDLLLYSWCRIYKCTRYHTEVGNGLKTENKSRTMSSKKHRALVVQTNTGTYSSRVPHARACRAKGQTWQCAADLARVCKNTAVATPCGMQSKLKANHWELGERAYMPLPLAVANRKAASSASFAQTWEARNEAWTLTAYQVLLPT